MKEIGLSTEENNREKNLPVRLDELKTSPGTLAKNKHSSVALKALFFQCITAKDFREVVKLLIQKAKDGEPWAIKELLDRAVGPAGKQETMDETGTTYPIRILIEMEPNADRLGNHS